MGIYSSEMDRIPAPKQNAVRRRTAVEKLKQMLKLTFRVKLAF